MAWVREARWDAPGVPIGGGDPIGHRDLTGQSGIGVQNAIDRRNEIPIDAVRADDGSDPTAPRDLLVVEVVPRELGAWRISDLELTYQSGRHRPRVATSTGELCVVVAAPGTRKQLQPPENGSAPEGVNPAHWAEYRRCAGH